MKAELAQQWLPVQSAIYDVMLVKYVSGMLKASFGSVYAVACLDLLVRIVFR